MKTKIILACIAVLILITIGGLLFHSYSQSQEIKKQLSLGNKYLQEQKYQEAILAFEKVIKIEPKNVEARIGLAKAYMGLDKMAEAEAALKEALTITRKNPEVYLELANLYLRLERGKDAIDILETGYSETNDSEIKKLLDELMTPPAAPEANVGSGSYDFAQEITINAPGDAAVYYTLDNTAPSTSTSKYSAPVIISEGKTILRVIAVSRAGMASKENKYEYSIEIKPFNVNDIKLGEIQLGMTQAKVIEVLGNPQKIRSEYAGFYNNEYTVLDYPAGSLLFNKDDSTLAMFKIVSNDIAVGYRNIRIGDSAESVIGKYPHKGAVKYPQMDLYEIYEADNTVNFGKVNYDNSNNISGIAYAVGWAESEVAAILTYEIVDGKVSSISYWTY